MPADAAPAWFVGAYPLLPRDATRAEAYRRLTARARASAGFRGLEVPFTGELDVPELAALLQPGEELVVTTIPGVVARLADDPCFGLASTDEDGRRRALEFTASARDAVRRLGEATQRQPVRAVAVHAAPAAAHGSGDALARSLEELAGWDWSGARILVEHCDAAVAAQPAAKGFLRLADELNALEACGAPDGLGVLVNWGRSAIEGRSPARAVDHLTEARERGLLRGLMFSGCSSDPDSRGGAWADVHLPPAPVDPRSLLDAETAWAAVSAAGELARLDVVGMKIGAPAGVGIVERERILTESARLLLAALGR